jgi:hypothetical protein
MQFIMKRGSIVMFRPGLAHEPDDDRQVGLVTSLDVHQAQPPYHSATPIAWVLWPGRRWPMALRRTQLEVLSE